MVPVPKAGLRDDCDRVKRVSKAGHENDSLWKAWKAKDLGFGAAGGGSEEAWACLAQEAAEKLCFVSGHNFSRAVKRLTIRWALEPA